MTRSSRKRRSLDSDWARAAAATTVATVAGGEISCSRWFAFSKVGPFYLVCTLEIARAMCGLCAKQN